MAFGSMAENCGNVLTRRGDQYDCVTPFTCMFVSGDGVRHQQLSGPPNGCVCLLRSRCGGEGWGGEFEASFTS